MQKGQGREEWKKCKLRGQEEIEGKAEGRKEKEGRGKERKREEKGAQETEGWNNSRRTSDERREV